MNLNESSFAVTNKVSVSINYENCLMQLFRDASFDMMIYNDCDDNNDYHYHHDNNDDD